MYLFVDIYLVFVDFFVQPSACQAQLFCRRGDFSAGFTQRLHDNRAFELRYLVLEISSEGERRLPSRCRFSCFCREVIGNDVSLGQRAGSLDFVFKLSNITWPPVVEEDGSGFSGHGRRRAASVFHQKVIQQEIDVFTAVAQRLEVHLNDV